MKLIGVDLGGTKVASGIVENRCLSHKHTEKTEKTSDDKLIKQIASCIIKVCESANLTTAEIAGVGIAVPGWVDVDKGIVLAAENTPLKKCELVKRVEHLTRIPTKIENDANCAALGEQRYGAARGFENVIMLTLGTGLGAGVIAGNRLISGIGATELGHLVMKLGGHPCNCGRFGCTEQYTSATALIRIAKEKAKIYPKSSLNEYTIDGTVVFALAKAKDEGAVLALSEFIDNLAEAILNFATICGPVRMVIGGGISNAGDELFIPLRAAVQNKLEKTIFVFNPNDIVPATLLNDAGIYGAAALFI